ncbi:MAG: ABC transporter substrate-binding protein [Propionibacteriaceae bacterium]|jgi:NitT/TauT family transport system substrate-binding protein|nr:ABC transporter substrate-binding protein [Propionibacteriaceae bacterium]
MKSIRVAAALLILPLAACAPAQTTPASVPPDSPAPPVEVVIGMSYIPNIQFAPCYVAEANGMFQDVDAQVTLRHHGSSEGLFTALGAGQEHFVIAGADEAMQAREQGLDLVAVAPYYQEYPVRIIAPTNKSIATLADLRGQRIGIPGRYGESWFGLLVALQSAGLTEADVEIMEIGYTASAALATDKVDAVVGFSNNDLVQFRLAGMDVAELPITAAGNPPLVGASIITTRSFLDENQEVARQVVAAIQGGIRAAAADPAKAVEISGDYVPGMSEQADAARATLDATLLIMAPTGDPGHLDADNFAAMADFLLAAGVLAQPADAAAAVEDLTEVGE